MYYSTSLQIWAKKFHSQTIFYLFILNKNFFFLLQLFCQNKSFFHIIACIFISNFPGIMFIRVNYLLQILISSLSTPYSRYKTPSFCQSMPMPHQLLKEPCHLKTDTGTDKRAFRYWLALAFWGSFSTTVSSPSILASTHPSGCLLLWEKTL